MKHLFFLLLSFGFVPLNAQEVKDMSKTMSLGPQHAYYIEIKDVSKKVIEDEWEKYQKEYFKKVKYNKKAKEFYTESGKIPLVNGTTPITLYSKLEEGRDLITLYAWVDLGGGFVDPEKTSESDGLRRFMGDFWVIAKKKAISIELEKEEDHKKGLEKDLAKLQKKKADLESDIEKYKEKIRQAEADIEQNLKDQDTKGIEIKEQIKVIEGVIERLNNVGKIH